MKPTQAAGESENLGLEVIWFLKLHDDKLIPDSHKLPDILWIRGRDTSTAFYAVEGKKRPGVVLPMKIKCGRRRVYCLTRNKDNKPHHECLGKVPGLKNGKESFLRRDPCEIVWVPDNLVWGNSGSTLVFLDRNQTSTVWAVVGGFEGYRPLVNDS